MPFLQLSALGKVEESAIAKFWCKKESIVEKKKKKIKLFPKDFVWQLLDYSVLKTSVSAWHCNTCVMNQYH